MRFDTPIKILAWLFIAFVAFLARRAPAQDVRPDSGTLVRVHPATEPGVTYEGRLIWLGADSVIVDVPGEGAARWHRLAVARLDIGRRGSRAGHTFIGMGVGLVAGAALGGAALYAGSSSDDFLGPEFAAAVGAVLGGTVGTVVGGIVGYNRPHTAWHEVPLTVGLQRQGLGISIAF